MAVFCSSLPSWFPGIIIIINIIIITIIIIILYPYLRFIF
jgi:hypothetical protein